MSRGPLGKIPCVGWSALIALLMVATAKQSLAIPAFARQYGTSCSTCHIDFPKLNDFGKAFKDAGFKFPKDDEQMLKIPAVMLGAPANAELWPKAIWPGTIPGLPPIGLRYNNFFQYTSSGRNNFNALPTSSGIPYYIPATDFQTGFFSIFTAGNFGSDIAFWVDDDISVSGANANGGLGEAYLKFVNLGRLIPKLPPHVLNIRVGQVELEIPFTQAKSIWISPYDIYSQANIGVLNPAFNQQFVSNAFAFAGSGKGIEFSGGLHTGGYNYSIAFIDQNTSGVPQGNTNNYVPTATGSNFGGVGIASDSNFKDIYTSFNYRFNLEKDKESRNSIQAAGPSGPRDHTYLNVGTYWLYGRSVQRLTGALLDGTSATLTAREPFYRVGGNATFNYHNLQFNALYMYGHDYNLLPVDSSGALVPLPVTGVTTPVGFVHGSPATFSGGFVDAEWLAYPWMYVMIRYDAVNSNSDYHNALVPGGFTSSPFNGAASVTRNRITPAVQFLIHANIKATAEYQFRPSQSVEFAMNPITGLPMAVNSFHTNTLVLGFEFVY
jgi:hypothetical protein